MDSKNYLKDTLLCNLMPILMKLKNPSPTSITKLDFGMVTCRQQETTSLGRIVTFPLKIFKHGVYIE